MDPKIVLLILRGYRLMVYHNTDDLGRFRIVHPTRWSMGVMRSYDHRIARGRIWGFTDGVMRGSYSPIDWGDLPEELLAEIPWSDPFFEVNNHGF